LSQSPRSSLATGEVAKRLKITRPTLQNMFDHIPHLYVLRKETRLFPLAYIDALVAYLARAKQPATIDSAASFWRTDEAQRLYAEAVRRYTEGLSGIALTGAELAGVLGVPYSTVMNWSQSGGVVAVRGQQGVSFPCDQVKTAIVWRAPVTRQPYIPPTGPSMFMSATDINEAARRQRRPLLNGTALFGQLQTPGGGRTIPRTYVTAILANTGRAIINDQLVLWFNAQERTRAIMREARTEFNRRLAEREESSPFANNMLPLEDVAWLLGMTTSMANIWCRQGQLTYVDGPGRRLVTGRDLLARCKWVLPTQR